MSAHLPLSVLEVGPVWNGTTAADSLRNLLELARATERIGYHRFWVAEHHATPCLATAATPVLVAEVAAATSTIRVGSGAVLLPNHPPILVAEQFGTLEALHPGRIDLGLGRAPGTDPLTSAALRRRGDEDYGQLLAELDSYFQPLSAERGNPLSVVPADRHRPPFWVLGSSPNSAVLAGRAGLPYAYAHQINPAATAESLTLYRESFRPSPYLAEPYALISALVTVGESDEAALDLARPYLLGQILLRTQGRLDSFPDEQEVAAHRFAPAELAFIEDRVSTQVIGSPETVRGKVAELVARTGADELMALTLVPDPQRRVRSYELLHQAVAAPVGAAL